MKQIGLNFGQELADAGLIALPFSWSADGNLTFSDAITPPQRIAIEAALAAHDPIRPNRDQIRAECGRRILAHISETAQRNLALERPTLAGDDAAVANAIVAWLGATLAACRVLAATPPADFTDAAHWPAWASTWDALVERF